MRVLIALLRDVYGLRPADDIRLIMRRPGTSPLDVALIVIALIVVFVPPTYFVATESGPALPLIRAQAALFGGYLVKLTWLVLVVGEMAVIATSVAVVRAVVRALRGSR